MDSKPTERELKTPRLTLRPIREDDWRSVQAIWRDFARSEYVIYDKYFDTDDEAVRPRIAKWAASTRTGREHIFYAVCLGAELIGYIALNICERGYELGYSFLSRHHGHGYAKESLTAVLGAARELGAERLTAGTALKNTPSVKLLQALGFVQTGTESLSFHKDKNGNEIRFDGGIFERKL